MDRPRPPVPSPAEQPHGWRAARAARAAAVALAAAAVLAACAGAPAAGPADPGPGPSGGAATGSGAPSTTAVEPGLTVAGGPSPAAPYPSAITDEVVAGPAFAPLARDIEERISQAGLPGASLLVLHRGQLVEQQAFGGYDLDTVVPIASASKWLAGVTIMALVDDGRIDLDAPIRSYLPDATGPSGAITTRQLLAFTSGLEYDEKIPCVADKAVSLADCNRQILELPLLGPPGTGYRYTGTHLHVAAGVAEAVTGQPFEEIFQARVARPLGMTRTSFVRPAHLALGADGHPSPAGSAVSTLGDYGRFLEMLVHDGVAPDGTRILSADAIAEMGRNQIADARFISAAAHRRAEQTPYGLAHWLDVVDADGRAVVESSPGKFGFRPWIDHANDVAGVYLVVDMDDARVADSPDRAATDRAVRTSGDFVLEGVARAVRGEDGSGG